MWHNVYMTTETIWEALLSSCTDECNIRYGYGRFAGYNTDRLGKALDRLLDEDATYAGPLMERVGCQVMPTREGEMRRRTIETDDLLDALRSTDAAGASSEASARVRRLVFGEATKLWCPVCGGHGSVYDDTASYRCEVCDHGVVDRAAADAIRLARVRHWAAR